MDSRQLSGNIYIYIYIYIYILQANGTAKFRYLHKPQEVLDLYGLETAVLQHVYNPG